MLGAIEHAPILGPFSVVCQSRLVLSPRSAALLDSIEPFEDRGLAEADVAAKSNVRDAIGPSLSEYPTLRHSERLGKLGGVD